MSDPCPPSDPRKVAAARDGTRRQLFLGLAAFTLIKAGEAMAADQPVSPAAPPNHDAPRLPMTPPLALSMELLPAPRGYALPPLAEAHAFSDTDFRPRGRSVFDPDPGIPGAGDKLIADGTVWQRLQQYRNRDGVRVVTLWESRASAVSIETNRRGGPSLQWTSRWMNRGGATRGLLDRWMPASIFRFSRSAGAGSGKTPSLPAAPHPGIAAIP